jgi:hypothetical protein
MDSHISFVVVGWNNADLIDDCLDSIARQTQPGVSTIYVDNASTDGSVEHVRSAFPAVEVIERHANTGFARGCNVGIRRALGTTPASLIGLLNTDARLAPDWATRIAEFAAGKPNGACFQGTTLVDGDTGKIDSTHIFVGRHGQAIQSGFDAPYREELGPLRVFGTNAAACAITRAYLEQQPFSDEPLDESFVMYLEDVDLAARATVMGWESYLVPGARAYHKGSSSTARRRQGYAVYMTYRNDAAMLVKSFPLLLLLRIAPRLVRSDLGVVRYHWRRDRRLALAMLCGRAVGLARAPLYLRARRILRAHRRIGSRSLWALMDDGSSPTGGGRP